MFITAQLIKLAAAVIAFHEAAGKVRAEGLGFASFLLTVAISFEQTSKNMSGDRP